MELVFLLLSLLLSHAIVLFIFLYLKNFSSNGKKHHPDLPPGRLGWPIIGESLDYFLHLRNCVPAKFVTNRIVGGNKIFKTSLLGETMAVFCGAEGNKFLFSNESKLVRLWWPSSINKIFPKSQKDFMKEDALKVRRILLPFLKADSLQEHVGVMDSVMKQHLNMDWINREVVKVSPAVTKYNFMVACQLFFSIKDHARVSELYKPFGDITAGTVSMAINFPGTAFNRAIKASKMMRKELQEIVKRRKIDLLENKAFPMQDLLSRMIVGNDENGQFMSDADIASNVVGLLHAGTHTLNVALTFLVMYLAELPHVYDGVFKEQMEISKLKEGGELLNWEDIRKMKYSWNVACEVMRLRPPSFGFFREAITDFTYAGYFIPKGWKLHLVAEVTHKNPEYFPDPEKFDPSRFEGTGPAPYTFIPFGGGPRMCPGSEYARLVILVFMHNLVTKFRWEKLIPDEKVVIDPLPRPTQGLPVRLNPHKA